MDERRGEPGTEEGVPILPAGRVHMEAPKEEKRHPAPSSGKERRTVLLVLRGRDCVRLPREREKERSERRDSEDERERER